MRTRLTSLLALFMTSAATAYAAPPCAAPEYGQFDFWIGEWRVLKPDGTVAGTNRIDREYGGCVLHERYQTAKGYSGESLNTYDPGRKRWHQTWVDNTGICCCSTAACRDSPWSWRAAPRTRPVPRHATGSPGRRTPPG